MNTTITRMCAAGIGVVSVSALALASPAEALTVEEDCATASQMANGDGNCIADVMAESASRDVVKGRVKSVNGVRFRSSSGAHVIARVQAHGATHKQMHGRKVTLKHAGKFNTSYVNLFGQEVWKMKWYPAGYTFVHGSDGYMHDPKCWNKVTGLPHSQPKAPQGHIQLHGHWKIVKVFRFSTSARAVLEQTSVSSATAWANGYLYDSEGNLVYGANGEPVNTCHAEGHGKASAYYKAVGSASLKGRVFSTASEAVSATVSGANADLNSQLQGKTHEEVVGEVWASARGKAITQASATAICTNTYQTPPPNQPPPAPENPTVSIGQVNQVPAGDTAMVCADYNVPSTDTGTLTFSSGLGSYPGGKTFQVSGTGTRCTTYQAPNDADKPSSDTLSVSLRDNTSTLSDNTPENNSTIIKITYDTPPL